MTLLLVFYTEPTRGLSPANAGARLHRAVERTPGAAVAARRDLGVVTDWGDEVDLGYECLLEATAANVAALIKAGLGWDAAALAVGRAHVHPPEALDRIYELQQRARPPAAEGPGSRPETGQPPRRWWRFWQA